MVYICYYYFSSQSEGNSMAPGQVPEMDTHWVETTDKKAAMRVRIFKLYITFMLYYLCTFCVISSYKSMFINK